VLKALRSGSLAATIVVAVLVVACGHATPTVLAVPSAPSGGPLVIVETRGGECPNGACGTRIVIETDGRVHASAPAPIELRHLTVDMVEALGKEVGRADFARLRTKSFTGTCPTTYDGQETVYTFATTTGTERIASCEFVVDPANPLFAAVGAALVSAGRPLIPRRGADRILIAAR
jgi:hypothetical protein